MPTAAKRLAEAKADVRRRAKESVARKKAAAGGAKKKAAAPKRTKGITNIIRRRSTQAGRAVKKALGN